MSIKSKLMLLALGAIAAFTTIPVNAGAVRCSEFDGFITTGTHDYNIIVDEDCYIRGDAIINGNLIEPSNTNFSIYVEAPAVVNGNVKESGPGLVYLVVGNGLLFDGNILEMGDGHVEVLVDGVFDGNVVELDEGDVDVQVFSGPPSGGPGLFIGSTFENGPGDAFLGVSKGEFPSSGDGEYFGIFSEKGPGACFIKEDTVAELPTVRFNCETVIWPN